MSKASLPYDAVHTVCQEIGILAEAIEAGCMSALTNEDDSGFNEHQNLWLMHNAARTIGLIADHCIGGQMRGTEGWLGLPNMDNQEGES